MLQKGKARFQASCPVPRQGLFLWEKWLKEKQGWMIKLSSISQWMPTFPYKGQANILDSDQMPQNTAPWHDTTNKMTVCTAKTQISLGIRPVWSESSLCTQWVAKDPSFLNADSEDSDQTGWMPRLIWVFVGRTPILLVLSCRGSTMSDQGSHSIKYRNFCQNINQVLLKWQTGSSNSQR